MKISFFILLLLYFSLGMDYSDWDSDKKSRKEALKNSIKEQRKPIERLEKDKKKNKTRIIALKKLRQDMQTLAKRAKSFYGVDSVFKGMNLSSSDDKTIKATYQNMGKSKPLDNYQFKVKQLAKGQKLISGEIPADINLPQSLIELQIGKEEMEFSFEGGNIYEFVKSFNKLHKDLRTAVVNKGDKKILILTSKITGEKNKIELIKDSSDVFSRLKLFKEVGHPSLTDLKETKKKYAGYFVKKKVVLFPSERITFIIKENAFFTTNNQFRFFFKKQSDSFLAKQDRFVDVINESVLNKDFSLEENVTVFPNMPTIQENNKIGLMEIEINGEKKNIDFTITADEKNKSFIYLLEDFNQGKKNSKVKIIKIVFLNRSKKRKYTFNVPNFLARQKIYVPIKSVEDPQDSVLEYEGIEFTHADNKVTNLIDGLSLELKQTNDKPIQLKVANDSVKIKNSIIDYINEYNDFIDFLNVLIARDEVPEDFSKDFKKFYGILKRETGLTTMRNDFRNLLIKKYQKEDKKFSHLFTIGIYPYYNRNELLNVAKIEFKENRFNTAFQEIDFELLKNLFAIFSSEKKNYISGYAFEINQLVRRYTASIRVNRDGKTYRSTPYIDLKIQAFEKENKDMDKDIAEKEEKLEEFREDTLEEFSRIDQAQKELEQARQQMQSLGR